MLASRPVGWQGTESFSLAAVLAQVVPERDEPGQGLAILHAVRSLFARDDVVEGTDSDAVDVDAACLGILESLDAVGGVH